MDAEPRERDSLLNRDFDNLRLGVKVLKSGIHQVREKEETK